jgi:hypothetical protein
MPTFVQFFRRSNPADWTAESLGVWNGTQLTLLCKLMGVPFGGSMSYKIEKLLEFGAMRVLLAPYDWPEGDRAAEVATIQRLANAYKARELKGFCRRVQCYAGDTKYGMAASLLGWRNGCRQRGQAVLAELNAEIDALPARQKLMPLEETAVAKTPLFDFRKYRPAEATAEPIAALDDGGPLGQLRMEL